jgi:HK97 family phage major capsid protein
MRLADDLNERRGRIVAELRAITESPAGDGGELSAEQTVKFDALKTELQAIEKRIERQTFLDECDRRASGERVAGSGDRRLDAELRSFSLRRAMLLGVPNHGEDCGRERELSIEIARRAGRPFQGICVPLSVFHEPVEQRVITTALPAGGPGSNLIATDHLGGMYIDHLRAAMIVRQLGARILTGLVGNVSIPRLKQSASIGWVAENSALTPSDQQHDAVELTPRHVGGIVEFSRNMLLQSSPDIEELIRRDFAAVIARAADAAAITGGGANEPDGVIASIDSSDAVSMTPPTWEAVLQLIEEVEAADSEGSAFVTSAAVVRKLRSTPRLVASEDGVVADRVIMEEPRMLAGYPLAQTSLCPAQHIVFGLWSDLLLGFWSELDVLVNPFESTAYSKGNVQVRGMATADIALRHVESFAVSSDVDTSLGGSE